MSGQDAIGTVSLTTDREENRHGTSSQAGIASAQENSRHSENTLEKKQKENEKNNEKDKEERNIKEGGGRHLENQRNGRKQTQEGTR